MGAEPRLSDADVARLREDWASGSSLADLAAEFAITPQYAGRLVRHEDRPVLDVDEAVESASGIRGAVEAFLADRVLDAGDDVLAETARALARKIDACASSGAATAANAMPRLAEVLVSALGELRGEERPPDRIDEIRERYLARYGRQAGAE